MTAWNTTPEGLHEMDTLIIGTSILVHRHINYPSDAWLLSGRGFLSGFDKVRLNSKDLEAAKREALHKVYGILYRLVKELGDA